MQVRQDGTVVPNRYQDNNAVPQQPSEATDARPGTEAKIIVMESRAAAGMHIHHPDDLTTILSTFEWAHGTDCL